MQKLIGDVILRIHQIIAQSKVIQRVLLKIKGLILSLTGFQTVQLFLLFEQSFYRENEQLKGGEATLKHYLSIGWKEKCNPHPLFDTAWYLQKYPDVAKAEINPLIHFIKFGWKEKRNPHPLFNTAWYLKQYPEVAIKKTNPLIHFIFKGWKEGKNPHPLFDVNWYLSQNKDVEDEAVNPLVHFVLYGWRENRNPNPLFNISWYFNSYPDVATQDINPLIEFNRIGWKRNRNPNPIFDTGWYLQKYEDVAKAEMNPLIHYLYFGIRENRKTNKWNNLKIPVLSSVEILNETTINVSSTRVLQTKTNLSSTQVLQTKINNKKGILLVAHTMGNHFFGGERSFIELISLIDKSNYRVVTVFPRRNEQFFNLIRDLVDDIVVIKYGWWNAEKLYNKENINSFRKIIKDYRIDFVHANTIMMLDPLAAARAEGIPGAIHARELISKDIALCKKLKAESPEIIKQIKESADYIIANSDITYKEFYKPNCIFKVYNTVRDDFFTLENKIDPNHIKVGLISSNIPKKGVLDFVQLAKATAKKLPQLHYYLIGPETDIIQQLRQEQKQKHLPQNIHFAGYQKSALEAHRLVNIVINFSSFAESFGRTIAEAMAAKRVAIVYKWGALPELVDDKETGYLIPYLNWKKAIPFLRHLATNPNEIERMGIKGRDKALRLFSRKAVKGNLNNIYDTAIIKNKQNLNEKTSEKVKTQLVLQANDPLFSHELPRLKIAYFLWHFPVPSETFVLNELRFLVEKNYDIEVFCKESPYKDFVLPFNIKYTKVKTPDDLEKNLVKSGINIVHAHFTYPTVTKFVWPVCEKLKLKFTFIAHAQDIFKYENREVNRISEIVASNQCLRVFTLGNFHRTFLYGQNVPKHKIIMNPQVIYNKDFVSLPKIKLNGSVCALGRFVEKKGFMRLIYAAKFLKEHNLSVHIYGYGPLEKEYKKAKRENNLNNVIIHPKLNGSKEVRKAFARHDLIIQPSIIADNGDMDGIPTVLVEAMSCGLPVLTTEIASIPDLVSDNVNGFIIHDNTPKFIASKIIDFYNQPASFIETIIDNAKKQIGRLYKIDRTMQTLVRVWKGDSIDIVIVTYVNQTYNNYEELKEVINRLFKYTRTKFNLRIVDNGSDKRTISYLQELEQNFTNIKVLFQDENKFVGPGTNIGISNSNSEYIVYLCGVEGFSIGYGWEQDAIQYMEKNLEVGLAGTLGYSPLYLTGKDYPKGIKLFNKFRNRDYAKKNPNKLFKHIQGGLFVLRRKMIEEIGGFSDDVPHSYTDVEYSYYVESRGWKLGEIPSFLALYEKTRPGILARIDEHTKILHPGTLEISVLLDKIHQKKIKLCNVCEWSGDAFHKNDICPNCNANASSRSVYRFFAETEFSFRRLAGFYVNPEKCLLNYWKKSFQGRQMSYDAVIEEIEKKKQLNNASNKMDIVLLNNVFTDGKNIQKRFFEEINRILNKSGTLVIQNQYDNISFLDAKNNIGIQEVKKEVLIDYLSKWFKLKKTIKYDSLVVKYDYQEIFVFEKKK